VLANQPRRRSRVEMRAGGGSAGSLELQLVARSGQQEVKSQWVELQCAQGNHV
jgi:hypothetical protein